MQFWTCSQKSSEAHDITPGPQSIVTWKVMSRTKLYEINYWNYSYFTLVKWNWNWRASFFKNPPDGTGCSLKCIESKTDSILTLKTFWDCQLLFYVKKLFVSEKTQKSLYVIKFFTLRTQTYAPEAKFDDINLLRKMTSLLFCVFSLTNIFFT